MDAVGRNVEPPATASAYGRTQRAVEGAAVAAYGACAVALLAQLVPAVATRPGVVLGAVLLGYAAADLLAGIVHWLADTYGSPQTPLVGPTLIYGFREHHDAPDEILQHDFVETNGAAAAAALPLGVLALTLPDAPAGMLFFKAALATLTLAVVATNQLHKWAHAVRAPAAVRVLQRLGVVLRPEAHARHHTVPFRTDYCITTGWLNAPLERLGLFRRVERAVAALARPGSLRTRVRRRPTFRNAGGSGSKDAWDRAPRGRSPR